MSSAACLPTHTTHTARLHPREHTGLPANAAAMLLHPCFRRCGGRPSGGKGYYVEPTVFTDVKDAMKISREESARLPSMLPVCCA